MLFIYIISFSKLCVNLFCFTFPPATHITKYIVSSHFCPYNRIPAKQAVQVVFSRKCKQIDHPKIYLNDIEVKTVNDHKHLGLILDKKLSFVSHINEKISKANKGLCIIKSLSRFLSVITLSQILCTYDLILIFVTSFTMYLVLQIHSTPQLTSII